ncbi:hypothetical protein Acal02_02032 [Acinetobacter calcoaceticus]
MPVNTILSLLKLKKELPEAIGYELSEEIIILPNEIIKLMKAKDQTSLLWISRIIIHNYTNILKKDIKILYHGNMRYDPLFYFKDRDVSVLYEINLENKEIIIHDIPPNESVYIFIYSENQSEKFIVNQILVENSKITKQMNNRVQLKKYPWLYRHTLLMIITIILSIGGIIFSGFTLSTRYIENKKLDDIYAEYESCSNRFFEYTDPNMERKFRQMNEMWKQYNLKINKVNSLDELKLKDEIVLCLPNKNK